MKLTLSKLIIELQKIQAEHGELKIYLQGSEEPYRLTVIDNEGRPLWYGGKADAVIIE